MSSICLNANKSCSYEEYLEARRTYCLRVFNKPDASNVILNQKSHLIGIEKVLDEMMRIKADISSK